MSSAGPSKARTLVLVTPEVLLNGLSRHLVFAFDDPDPGLGVNKLKVDRLSLDAVAFEVDLEIN